MRLIFAGTSPFAATALQALHDAGHTIPLILTQPDRAAGRGMQLQPSAVKRWALQQGCALLQPARLTEDLLPALLQTQAEAMIVAAYGLLLPPWLLSALPLGCINIHASLLPRWRGAAPIERAIEAGDVQTGISIMQMDAGLDTGPVLLQEAINIGAEETAGELHERLAVLGGRCIVCALHQRPSAQLQSTNGVTLARKIDKAEAELSWQTDAATLMRKIHALNPRPGARMLLGNQSIKVWRARAVPGDPFDCSAPPGALIHAGPEGVDIATASGALRLLELQRAGGRRLSAAAFAAGLR